MVWVADLVILGGLFLMILFDLPDAVFSVQEMCREVEPMSMSCDNQKKFTIGCADTVLLWRKDGSLAVPRNLETTFAILYYNPCVLRSLLAHSKHRPEGEVYLVVDKMACRQESEKLLNTLSIVATNVFVVGVCASNPPRNVCERWKGSWDKMVYRGRAIDISCIGSLWYVDPYVWCRPYAWVVDFANGCLSKRFEQNIIY